MQIIYDIKHKIASEWAVFGFWQLDSSTCVNCTKWFLKLPSNFRHGWWQLKSAEQLMWNLKHPVNSCMIIAYNTVYCVQWRIWQFLLLFHHDVSSDLAWWLPCREPCMSCQSPASAGLGSPRDNKSRSEHVGSTCRWLLIMCSRLWLAARHFWPGFHLVITLLNQLFHY